MAPSRRGVPASYLELVRHFPLRPIRDEAEYDRAVEVMNKLAVRDEDSLDAGEQDYLDAIAVFVSQYDHTHREIDRDATPLEIVKYLLAENDLSVSDVGRIIGSQPAASMILSGKRQISKAHAKALAARFAVDAGVFL